MADVIDALEPSLPVLAGVTIVWLGLRVLELALNSVDPRDHSFWLRFPRQIALILRKQGLSLENIDASLIAEAPKIGPHLPAMKTKMAQALGVEPGRIGIKATTNERLGFIGRGDGMAAMAVASVSEIKG